jgi:hypothetical protein
MVIEDDVSAVNPGEVHVNDVIVAVGLHESEPRKVIAVAEVSDGVADPAMAVGQFCPVAEASNVHEFTL